MRAASRRYSAARKSIQSISHRHQIRRNSTNAIIQQAEPDQTTSETPSNGPLAGRAIAVKDNIVTSSSPTTAASRALSRYNSPYEATVVKLLRTNGAHIVSKTNLDEFGMGSHSQTSAYGSMRSLYKRKGVPLSPGGSSGGSAVAVAQDECWAALGTDTGGSVRLPAAYTGTVGFKPSYGLLSRWGVIQYANSLDTVGILAKQVADVREVFARLHVHDPQDPTSLPQSVRDRMHASQRKATSKLRIGIPTSYNTAEISFAVKKTYTSLLTNLQNQGHSIIPISLPTTPLALSAYYILAPAEASSNLAKYDGIRYGHRTSGADREHEADLPLYARTRGEAFGEEVQRRILLGAYTLSSEVRDNYFVQAQKVRRLVQRDFDGAFATPHPLRDGNEGNAGDGAGAEVDVVLTPTAPTLPPTVEEVAAQGPVERYMNDVFTVPASLACLPAFTVPVHLPQAVRESMDVEDVQTAGMQIIGQFGDDEMVLHVAEILEAFGVR